jgi:hypothetical protein
MRVLIEMIYAICVEEGAAPLDAMNMIALLKKKLCEIRSVLTRYTGNQSCSGHARPCTVQYLIRSQSYYIGDWPPMLEARVGLEAARKLGRKGGRKRHMTESKIESAKRLLANRILPRGPEPQRVHPNALQVDSGFNPALRCYLFVS